MMESVRSVEWLRDFHELKQLSEVERFIQDHELAFLFISRKNCSVCMGLKPQIQQLMADFPKIAIGYVDADQIPEIAGRFSIFTVPVLLLLIEGKEYIREARIVHTDILNKKLQRVYENMVGN